MSGLFHWLRMAVTHNLGLKALALTFALGFFVYEQEQAGDVQRTLSADVVLHLPIKSKKLELMTAIPGTVQFTVRGPAGAVAELLRGGLAPVDVNLSNGDERTLAFTRSMFDLPANVELMEVALPPIELDWQPIISRALPVLASLEGEPDSGHIVEGAPRAEPARVIVEGPKSVVDVLQTSRAVPFRLSGLGSGSYTRLLALEPAPPRTRYQGAGAVEVTVKVAREELSRRFVRPVEVVGALRGLANPPTVVVTVYGPPELVRTIEPGQVLPVAEVGGAAGAPPERHGSVVVNVRVPLSGVRTESQPPSVAVRW